MDDVAVLLLEKQAFKERDVQTELDETSENVPRIFSDSLQVCMEFINNIYGSFQCVPSSELNSNYYYHFLQYLFLNILHYIGFTLNYRY